METYPYCLPMNPDQKKQDAYLFLTTHRIGVLATLSPDATPRARTVYYACDESFNIYILTLTNTRKAWDLDANGHAAFVVSAEDVPQTLQIEGTVTDVSDEQVNNEIVHKIFEQLESNAQYHAPLTRFDAGVVRFFKLTPTWIRWGDFTKGNGSEEVFFQLLP